MNPEHSQSAKNSAATNANPITVESKAIRAKDVLAYIAVLSALAGGLYYVVTFGADVKATVECLTIQGGYNCQVSLISGTPSAISVCWNINSVCSNGIRSSAKKYFKGTLVKDIPARLLIANSDIKNHDQCDHISATTVENVELGISNGIITKGTFH